LTRPLVRESCIPGLRGFDVTGAATITSSLALLVYGISKAPDVGWASGRPIGLLIAAAALFAAFLVTESRHPSPMMPFRIFRVRTVTGANVAGFLLGAVVFANFFLLTLYVQQVLHYSALKAGLTFLATAGTVIPVAGLSQALVTKVGVRPVLVAGLALLTGGMLWYTQIPVHGSHEAGLASGLINTSQQIGGALGIAIAATVAFTHAKTLVTSGHDQLSARRRAASRSASG
jgi:hypothetical protein